jgi:hypothetical protein
LGRRAPAFFFFALTLGACFAAGFFRAVFFFAARFGSMISTVGRAARFAGLARRFASSSAMALPRSAGDFTVRAPAASSARYLSAAVPLPPAITAPA